MIFATDHPAGDRIMTNLYNRAAYEFPVMRQEASPASAPYGTAAGVRALVDAEPGDGVGPAPADEELYVYAPPWEPFGAADSG